MGGAVSRLASPRRGRRPRSSPLSMERLRHSICAELGAETARPVLRSVDEDAATGRARADPEALPAIVSDRLQQRHRRCRSDCVRDPADPENTPLLPDPLKLRFRRAHGQDPVELLDRCRFAVGSEGSQQRISENTNLSHISVGRPQGLTVAAPRQEAPERGGVREQLGVFLEQVPRIHEVDRELDRIVLFLEHPAMLTSKDQIRLMILTVTSDGEVRR